MRFVWNTKVFWLIEFFGVICNIIITILHDVIIYEATTGLTFNWLLLIANPYIWVIFALQILYAIIKVCVDVRTSQSDDRLKRAIEDQEIKLISQVTTFSKKGDFTSVDKVIKALDKLEERRNK